MSQVGRTLGGPVPGPGRVRRLLAGLGLVVSLVSTAGCGDDGSGPARDGFVPVGTGDTYGEWELFAEYEDGEWTGCLRIDHYDTVERCAGADAGLVTFESGDGATFGAVPEGGGLEFDDGDRVPLLEGRFFVVASEAAVRLRAQEVVRGTARLHRPPGLS